MTSSSPSRAPPIFLDYLVEEVVRRQSARVQNFLQCTAILDRFSTPLCGALLEQPATGVSTETNTQTRQQVREILEYLERSNLFLFSLDVENILLAMDYGKHDLAAQRPQ